MGRDMTPTQELSWDSGRTWANAPPRGPQMSWGPRRYECYASEASGAAAPLPGASVQRLTRIQEIQGQLSTAAPEDLAVLNAELAKAYQAAA